jgi:ABC-type dipeptide/oligopeptide/nickel transport system permease component
MLAYIWRRVLAGLLTLWGVATVVFALLRLLPGDPAETMLAQSGASPAAVAALRLQLGLDQPLGVQYVQWLHSLALGDLGESLFSRQPVAEVISQQLPFTAALAAAALIWSLTLGLALGIGAARWAGRWPDHLAMTLAVAGSTVPIFWSGLLMIWIFAVGLRWLPATGVVGWRSLLMPSLSLGFASAGPIARLTRAQLLHVLAQPFVTAARGKGLSPRQVIARHALRNAAIPLLTLAGLQISFMLGGTVITETVFGRPGIGRLLVEAILNRDLPVVQAVALLIATTYVLVNLAVDLAAGWLDPQIAWR